MHAPFTPDNPTPSTQDPATEAAAELEQAGWPADAPVAVDLDVRPIFQRGGEPCGEIMAAAARVPEGHIFRLRVPFEPRPLYAVLGGQGFVHRSRQLGPDDWEVQFLKSGPTAG